LNPCRPLFDAHLHIIDPRFPLIPNQGYTPDIFTCSDYLQRLASYTLAGGAIVSGSFQGLDQTYLLAALETLGSTFVGVTQLPVNITDQDLLLLDKKGVRAVRFNLRRGGSEQLRQLDYCARRVHELAGWHVELYADSTLLEHLFQRLIKLPAVSIDHLGLSTGGFKTVLKLAAAGVRVKASGFGRVDFPVASALRALYAAHPEALMFGTDLPSTRARRPYRDTDYSLLLETLGEAATHQVTTTNALKFYRCKALPPSGI
jgi:predicted TIM-barrel fold metal-dependent hydrolase